MATTKRAMKMSRLYAPTLKEEPAEAELASHRLLLRAGMIRKEAAGLYTYLPLAWRAIRKIEDIVRDEMDSHDAQELMMPIMVDAELWRESGRIDAYGKELVRFDDRHGREFVLGPTHEETITALVRNELRSYKQLPVNLYHIQDKFRDEFRPRYGLMRGREFIMKDAYSFSATQESLQEEYDKMKEAYANICVRCGVHALPVVADSGEIGGDTSVEFMALADAGEASLVYCDDCGFAADDEAASTKVSVTESPGNGTLEKVETPGLGTIEAVAEFFGFPKNGTRKSLALIDSEGKPVVAIVPGDHELNECKAEHVFGKGYRMMTDEELEKFGLFKGFIGPVHLPAGIKLVCDSSLKESKSWACGANEIDYHFTGACPDRDFKVDEWADLVTVLAGDPCPHCGKPLSAARGIEVSQVFQLGTKYSEAMGATFMDEDGKEKPLIMGCYGVGVSRTLAAIVEQHNDENGIIWPVSVAPYEVSVIPLDPKKEDCAKATDRLVQELLDAGLDVVVDDRDERPGFKFADNDLMGFPYQIVIGKRGLKNGTFELKDRATGEREDISIDEAAAIVAARVREAKQALS
ncbi:proline--tRNA ligase [Collinsella sp. CAG:289]|nr:proline--tRNA ligase [Collinsella sp. CAG:289]